MVRLPVDDCASRILVARIPYSIAPRTKTGEHYLWFDVLAPVVTKEGIQIEDVGVVRTPFNVDTRLRTKLLMLLLVCTAVFLFVLEWLRVDVVAILMMVLLPELGLIDARDTFTGLSSNAVVAIIGVMLISYGLNRVGLVSRMIHPLMRLVHRSASRLTVIFSALIALISSVMQNTGAAVLFLPAIRLATCNHLGIPLSHVLMPIGMAAILGGTMTMIGTSPLILLNDLLPAGMPKFGLLDLFPIGLALVIGGIAYLATLGRYLLTRLPAHRTTSRAGGGGDVDSPDCWGFYDEIGGPYELSIPANWPHPEVTLEIAQVRRRYLVNIVAIVRADGVFDPAPAPSTILRPGIGICAFGPEDAVRRFAHEFHLVLRKSPLRFKHTVFNPGFSGCVELVVSPRSRLIGRTIKEISFRETFGVNVLALHQGETIYYQKLADRPLQAGDAIFAQGPWRQFHNLQEHHQALILISRYEKEFQEPENTRPALLCFLGTLALMLLSSFYFQKQAYNPIPLSVCLMLGAVGMIVSGVFSIKEAYEAVEWRTVFLLSGLIPLGMAVQQTGTAEWIAQGIVAGLGSYLTPLTLLVVLALLSCCFTLVMSNVGACTLLVPLGISLASQIGVDARVAVIVVGLGVSNSFILPTHQVNALYMGPGEYRTKDYIKIGVPLSAIYILTLVTITYFFYL
jgi:di/tricarboxylate transporter